MGLAASQARLLMLTARKDDVEGQLMRIANQKLSLSRKSAEIAQEYNDALNATQLVYNTGTGDVPLSYGFLMSPTTNCMLNDSYGRVVLDDGICAKLGLTTGSSDTGGDFASKVSPKTFLDAMTGTSHSDSDISTLVSSNKPATTPPSSGGTAAVPFTTNYQDSVVFENIRTGSSNSYGTDKVGGTSIQINGPNNNAPYCFSRPAVANDPGVITELNNLLDITLGGASKAVIKAIQDNMDPAQNSSISGDLGKAATDAETDTRNFYTTQFNGKNTTTSLIPDTADSKAQDTGTNCAGTNSIWFNLAGDHCEFYIDLTQVVLTFLAFFDQECGNINGTPTHAVVKSSGDTSSSGVEVSRADNVQQVKYSDETGGNARSVCYNGVTQRKCTSTVRPTTHGGTDPNSASGPSAVVGATAPPTGGSNPAATDSYYYNIYLQICKNGWIKDSGIDNNDYMQGQIQGGTYQIEQFNNGAWSTLSTSSPSSKLSAKAADETAVEAKYDAMKDEIDVKEKTLDLSMNDLDTERQAVTTDMDSVKKIIDKAVESLKLFQQG